jgi:cytochrome P450
MYGDHHLWIQSLHKRYGPVVRVAPYSLSFTDGRAWKDIYGFRKADELPFDKELRSYGPDPNGVRSMLTADDETHAYMRRIFAHAFSERALREQEQIFAKHIDSLVAKLHQEAKKSDDAAVDMVRWLNFTTFDIMADLTFGESLGMLDNSDYIPWVSTLFASMKAATIARALQELPGMRSILPLLIPKSLVAKREAHFQFSGQRVTRRLETKTTRPDIWTIVLRHAEAGRALTFNEMHSNAGLFMTGGSETTSSELAALLYLLCQYPDKMKKLMTEIRSECTSEAEISMEKLGTLKYLNACIAEGLRLYPPLALGLPRIVPKDGAEIAGSWIPGGVRIPLVFSAYCPTDVSFCR